MRDLPPAGRWNQDSRYHLVGTQIMLPLPFTFGGNVELLQWKLSFPLGALQMKLGSVRDQNGSDGGWADELCGPTVAENGVKAVVTVRHQILSRFILGQESKSVAEVPAAWPLAEIAAERSQVSNLRTCSLVNRLRQSRITFPDTRVLGQFAQRG